MHILMDVKASSGMKLSSQPCAFYHIVIPLGDNTVSYIGVEFPATNFSKFYREINEEVMTSPSIPKTHTFVTKKTMN